MFALDLIKDSDISNRKDQEKVKNIGARHLNNCTGP